MLYLIWKNPWMTVSRDTYVSAMLAAGWLENAAVTGGTTLPGDRGGRYGVANADRMFCRANPTC